MAFLELCLYVIECFRKYILLLISVQNALQKCKFQLAANSAHVQRIPATRLISQHSESDFVKLCPPEEDQGGEADGGYSE